MIISQVVLAGEICFKRGIRDTGSDTEQTHTQINLKSSIEDRCDLKKWGWGGGGSVIGRDGY